MDISKMCFEKCEKYSLARAKFILIFIGITNITFIFFQSRLQNNLLTIIIQIVLAMLLFKGSNIIRILFIASVAEEILFLLKFYFFTNGTGVETIFIDTLYFNILIVFCILTLYFIICSKDVKYYFNKSNFDTTLKQQIIVYLKNTTNCFKKH